ncbi:MAG: ABC transporter substrate-binding protein [Alphaproteobacteria bacterium]|nr:ABC transporter substrate-binding protein [Alphaproteobacteria bacterium]
MIRTGMAATLVAGAMVASMATAQEKVTFGTNWKAQAEHGGYYYAVAEGIYKKYGLDVTIRPGGPQVNHNQLIAAGKIDFNMGSSLNGALNFLQNKIPVITIAAVFQKDPQVLICHANAGADKLSELKGKTILISSGARTTYWPWLKAAFGYTDDMIKPYTFNPGPFLADKNVCQQGYVTSEPFKIAELTNVAPVIHLLADNGYDTYSTTIEVVREVAEKKPDMVQRFVNGTIEGWYGYMYKDRAKANALIKTDNPEMTDAQLAFSHKELLARGIVDSGDTKTMGIGAMVDARWDSFYKKMIGAGVFPAGMPIKEAYTLRFVNQKVGM